MSKTWVITGVNKLSRQREEISGHYPTKEEAEARLQREEASRSRQKYRPYTRLRVERSLPVQLLIKFV